MSDPYRDFVNENFDEKLPGSTGSYLLLSLQRLDANEIIQALDDGNKRYLMSLPSIGEIRANQLLSYYKGNVNTHEPKPIFSWLDLYKWWTNAAGFDK